MPRNVFLIAVVLLLGCSSPGAPEPEVTVPSAAEAPDGRLGDLAAPVHYDLEMRIDPRSDGFTAAVGIEIELARPAEGVWLHGRDLEVSSVEITSNDRTTAGSYAQVLPTGVAFVSFGRTLAPGRVRIDIAYSGEFDRNLAGMFKVEERGESFVLAKSESIQARRFVIGFDEPGFKATWDVVLEIPAGYVAVANGPELRRTVIDGEFERVEFGRIRPTSTFLLSLAVGPFEVVEYPPLPPNEIRAVPIPLRGIARAGKTGELSAILELTAPMVETFETALRQPYPYPKLDIVAAPSWPSGATELAAAPTYREQVILLGEDPSPGAIIRMQSIHAHEIAHMWFGNLVTPPWWDDLWLKEGFATWGTPTSLTEIDPDGGHELTASLRYLSAMGLDTLASARAIREPVTSNATVRSAYDSITYSKSLAMLTMIDKWFGAERFRPALGTYLETYADRAADSDEFYRTIGEASGEPRITEVFQSFVEQNGLPLLEASLECASRPEMRLRQSRFAPPGSTIDPARTWSIPVCVRYPGGATCEILTARETRLQLESDACPAWFLVNGGGTGYFRTAMAESDWRALLEHWGELTPPERILAFDSLAAQAAAEPGLEPVADEMARQIALSDRWQVAVQPFAYWNDRLRFSGEPEHTRLQKELAGFLRKNRLRPVGPGSSADERLYQYRLQAFMAMSLEDRPVQKELAELVNRFIDGENSALATDQYYAAVFSFVRVDPEGFEKIVAVRAAIDDPRFDDASARALGRADIGRFDKTIAYLFSDATGPREAYGGLMAAVHEDADQANAWAWFIENHQRVEAKIPAQWVARLPAIGTRFCDESLALSWRAWMSEWVEQAPGGQRAFNETAERIELCLARKRLISAAD